jgi:hypothetical protein
LPIIKNRHPAIADWIHGKRVLKTPADDELLFIVSGIGRKGADYDAGERSGRRPLKRMATINS